MTAPDPRVILLVDDDDAFRGRLAEAMRRRGLEPLQARGVAEAMTLLGNHPITDVVLDLRMPGEGGATLIPLLLEQHPQARIVVLTGFGSIPAAKEALRMGVVDFLTKPADADQILAALDGQPAGDDADSVPTLDQVEWDHIQRVLASTGNNISAAARLLGIDRRSLQRKLSKYSPH